MDGILGDCDFTFCTCYIDILIFSSSQGEQLCHLSKVLECLQQNGLVIHYDKCLFGSREVDFLKAPSHSCRSFIPTRQSVHHSRLTTVTLQEFVGVVNYHHRFLSRIAYIMAPLYEMLAGKAKDLARDPS